MSYHRIFEIRFTKTQLHLLKEKIAHDLVTLSNYKEHEKLWKHFLIDDVLGLAYVLSQHGNSIQKITGVSNKNSVTESSLGWAFWVDI